MTKIAIMLCSTNAMAKLGRNEDIRVGGGEDMLGFRLQDG